MDKKYLSKLTIDDDLYILKDAEARQDIEGMKSSIISVMHWVGYTTTALTDGDTINPILIDDNDYIAKAGDVVAYKNGTKEVEYAFNGTKWQEFGSTSKIKALAFKDNATGNITISGNNSPSAVSFSGTSSETVLKAIDSEAVAPSFVEGSFTPASISEGFVTVGSSARYSHDGFSGGSLGQASTSIFATEGVISNVVEDSETLVLTAAPTSNAVITQGVFTPAVYGTDTFDGGTPTVIDVTKFDGGSKAADIFNAGSSATFTTQSVITNLGTATAEAQVFNGDTVNVTVT